MTTQQVAARFHELAKEEKWFEIQDELFSDDVQSIEPKGSPYMPDATGKLNVRNKATKFVSGITAAHERKTSDPIVAANHFAVSRLVDIEHNDHGRIQINQIMLYEVKDGKIVSETFFY